MVSGQAITTSRRLLSVGQTEQGASLAHTVQANTRAFFIFWRPTLQDVSSRVKSAGRVHTWRINVAPVQDPSIKSASPSLAFKLAFVYHKSYATLARTSVALAFTVRSGRFVGLSRLSATVPTGQRLVETTVNCS